MVGYDLIHSVGPNTAVLSLLVTGVSMVALAVIQMWGDFGMGEEWEAHYGALGSAAGVSTAPNASTPIISFVPTKTGHKTILTRGRYADKSADFDYTWKWIAGESRMGWVQKEPEPTVSVFCSPGLQETVNEILEKRGKVAYK